MSAVLDDDLTLVLGPAHVFHSCSVQGALAPLVVAGDKGSRLWEKTVTARWRDPSHGGINLGFPQNS